MKTINSVLGSMSSTVLGFTLMHEHIVTFPPGVFREYPDLLEPDLMARVIDALKKAKEGGIETIVDATTFDLGRDINLVAEASRRSGVNIIACTGWWLNTPKFHEGISADALARVFTREIEQGISGTNIKAGILKSASDKEGVTPDLEIALRAVARAHHQTGVPIMLHSFSPGQVGRQQLAILKEEGVDLKRVKMDHSNDTTDIGYLTWLLEQGCYLGMDRYPGRNVSPPDRTRTMKALIDAGYASRICPSHDWAISRVMPLHAPTTEEERLRRNPDGHLYMKNVVFQQLREMGTSEAIINGLCIEAPRNFFEGV